MSLNGSAYIVGAYEHPTRKADDLSVVRLHADVAKGALEGEFRPGVAASAPVSPPLALRVAATTGWRMRWITSPCAPTICDTESTRKGMSSLTICSTVCADSQPCFAAAGLNRPAPLTLWAAMAPVRSSAASLIRGWRITAFTNAGW